MAATHITKDNFEEFVMNSSEPVLVDFWASWCGPCKALGPVVEELAANADGFKVGKINVDDEEELAEQFGIASIPTVLVFKEGKVVNKSLGLVAKSKLLELIKG